MRLYDSEWAPNPRRVRIFLAEKGIDIPRVPVDLRRDEQLGAAYLAINPRGTVPALVLDSGEVIADSVAICRYLEALHPQPALFGTTPIEAARVTAWTNRIESDGYAAVVYAFRNARAGFAGRGLPGRWPPMPMIPELVERGRLMWDTFTEALDTRLGANDWIAGADFSFADITALITVDFAARIGLAMPPGRDSVARWHAAASARPSAAA